VALGYRRELEWGLAAFDRPVIGHLRRILGERAAVLDLGGNIGLHYVAYRRHLPLEQVRWIVWDQPEMVRVGRETCAGNANVAFVESAAQLQPTRFDALLASASLQYVDDPMALLASVIATSGPPRHILVNRVPLYEGEGFVTLQNAGPVCYPQHVFNRDAFVRSISALGYELTDFWDDEVDSCLIPFHPDRSVRVYKGLCFRGRSDQLPATA
jgi:putative methyltransferase (TIGR04325 family)